MCRVKGKLQVEASFKTALPSLTSFYARLLDDPPPYVSTSSRLLMLYTRLSCRWQSGAMQAAGWWSQAHTKRLRLWLHVRLFAA